MNTALLDRVTDDQLITNLFQLSSQAFASAMQDKRLPDEVSLTCYSLFKQISMGDADESEKNRQSTPRDKYNVWL